MIRDESESQRWRDDLHAPLEPRRLPAKLSGGPNNDTRTGAADKTPQFSAKIVPPFQAPISH